MEQQSKNELGNIYGSRISKNGKWLNLVIVTRHGNETIYITCPVRMEYSEEKPFATIVDNKALISNVPVYMELKKEEKDETPTSDDLPF